MKKFFILFLMCALLPRTAGAQELDGTFEISDLTYQSRTGLYYFDVSLANCTSNYSAYNLDIILPNGIDVALDEEDNYRVSILTNNQSVYPYRSTYTYDDDDNEIETKTYYHTVGCQMPTAHQLRVSCIDATYNAAFVKTVGKLFRVFVSLNNAVLSESFSPKPIVKLSGLNLTTSAAVKYVPADFSCRPFTTGIPTSRTLSVNVSSTNKIGTLILPFDTDLPSGLKAYSCNGAVGDLLTLTEVSSIEACKPYIVYAENGYSTDELTGTARLTDGANVTDVFTDGYLTGVLTGTTVNTGYILQNQNNGDGPMFYNADGVTFSLPAGRCYLTPTGSSVKAFGFNFGDTDRVEKTFNSPSSIFNIFDLQGRKVSSPTRGIYIQGTRKVVVK